MYEIQNYKDALYHVKRGFLIIGLTGFTGSGCSTVREILEKKKPLKYPGDKQLFMYHLRTGKNEADVDLNLQYGKSQRNKRIYDKLKRTWNDLDWKPFIPIKVSTMIFVSAILRSLEKANNNDILKEIGGLSKKNKNEFEQLRGLWSLEKPANELSESIIKGYELADKLYDIFKKNYDKKLGELTELMQDFGDHIRSYGIVMPESSLNVKPANLFVLPEALRRLISAYRYAQEANHFVIDAFVYSCENCHLFLK